jgi:hypothetical protein
MSCDLTDEEDAALGRLLSDTINDDRYLLLARIRLFKTTLGRTRPERPPAPLPRRSATGKSIGLQVMCRINRILESPAKSILNARDGWKEKTRRWHDLDLRSGAAKYCVEPRRCLAVRTQNLAGGPRRHIREIVLFPTP